MSDFLHSPNFKPDEEFKSFIDSLFELKPKIKPPQEVSNLKLNIPDPKELEQDQLKLAQKIANDEFEAFKVAFLDFQDRVSDMAIYTFLYPSLEEFGEVCAEMVDLVEDNFNQKDFTDVGKGDYQEAMKVRSRILASIYNKYKNSQ